MKLKYFSHSAFQVTTSNGKKILIDPFLDDNPTSPVKSEDVNAELYYSYHTRMAIILVIHLKLLRDANQKLLL